MIASSVVALVLAPRLAAAGPGPAHELPVTPLHIDLAVDDQPIGSIDYFRVVAGTPQLTGQLNAMIAEAAGALGVLARIAAGGHGAPRIACEPGIATDGFVSWKCVRLDDSGPAAGITHVTTAAYYLDGGQLREATVKAVFASTGDLATRLAALGGARDTMTSYGGGSEACHVEAEATTWFVNLRGIEFQAADGNRKCQLSWDTLEPVLVADSPARRLADDRPDEPRQRPSLGWNKAAPRFVALPGPDDAVLDRLTGLVWAARDNGADISWPAAMAYARGYRGGGHADWRLPSEQELEMLAEPEMAHRERSDCTRGKLDFVVTALIHPSCGLAWSSTPIGADRAVAFGLISGTSRVARRSQTRNYRALVVRDPRALRPLPPPRP